MADYSFLSPEQIAIKQQMEIHQLQSASANQMTSSMLAMSSANNAAQLAANQQRMQQMQLDILRGQQMIANQLDMRRSEMRNVMYGAFAAMPGADPGTTGIFGRNYGIGPGGYTTQSLGGQIYDAFGGRMLNRFTGGIFGQDWAFRFGASRAEIEKRAQDELMVSLKGTVQGAYSGIIPQFIRARLGDAFVGQRADTQRAVAATFGYLRGRDLGDFGTPGMIGAGLRSSLVETLSNRMSANFEEMNNRYGIGSITDQDFGHLRSAALTMLSDERVMRAALKKGEGLTGEARGVAVGNALADVNDKFLSAIKELSDNLQLNVEATDKLVGYNRSQGFSSNQLLGAGRFIRSIQSSFQVPGDTAIMTMMGQMAAGRARGFAPGQFARTETGLALRMMRDFGGEEDRDFLYKYGGENDFDAASRHRAAQASVGAAFAQQYGGSLGILAGQANNPLARGAGLFGMGSVASALSADPYAALGAMMDPTAQRNLSQNASDIVFDKLSNLPMYMDERQKIIWFAQATGQDPVTAKQEWDRRKRKSDAIRKELKAQGSKLSVSDVLSWELTAINRGLPVLESMSDLVSSATESGVNASLEEQVNSLPLDVIDNAIRSQSDQGTLVDPKTGRPVNKTGDRLERRISGYGVFDFGSDSADIQRQKDILKSASSGGVYDGVAMEVPSDGSSSSGSSTSSDGDGIWDNVVRFWNPTKEERTRMEDRSRMKTTQAVEDSKLRATIENWAKMF